MRNTCTKMHDSIEQCLVQPGALARPEPMAADDRGKDCLSNFCEQMASSLLLDATQGLFLSYAAA